MARYDPATRGWSGLGGESNRLGGTVSAVAVVGTRVFVSGELTIDSFPTRGRVVEFEPQAGRWTSPGGDPANDLECVGPCIRAMVAAAGVLIAAGEFNSVGSTPLLNVARFDLAANRWFGLGAGGAVGVDGRVHALAIDGDTLLAAGYFERAGAASARNLALYDLVSGEWSALGGGEVGGVERGIAAVAMDDDAIYIGGTFRLPGSPAVSALARFDRALLTWTALDIAPADGVLRSVRSLVVANGVLLATGICRNASSSETACTMRVPPDSGIVDVIGGSEPIRGADVNQAIAVLSGTAYVGGDFSRLHGASANGIVELPAGSAEWNAVGNGFGLGLDRPAATALWDGEDLLVGGRFGRAGNVDARGIARLSARQRQWQSIGTAEDNGVAGIVRAVAVRDRITFVGGELEDSNRMPGSPVRQFDPAIGRWEPVDATTGPRMEGSVWHIKVEPDGLLVGGDLVVGANRIRSIAARWSESNREWISLSPVPMPPSNVARSLLVFDGGLYAAGRFPPGGFAATRTALRFDVASASWVSVGLPTVPQPFGGTLQAVDGQLWLGGRFDALGLGAPAVIVSLSSAASTWAPVANAVSGMSIDPITAITPAAGQVVVAGEFSSFAGVSASNIVRREAGVWQPVGAGIDGHGRVDSVVAHRSRVVAAGSFGSAGEWAASNIAVHDLDPGFRDGFEAATKVEESR